MIICKKCRKFGNKLFLKGSRCLSPKCSFTRRSYQPGAHGPKTVRRRKSEYGLQLLEKQKAKSEYGLREKQFARLFNLSLRSKENTGFELLKLLEMRMDNIIYRIGWASSRRAARQMISHRKFKLNEKIVNIASIALKEKDTLSPFKQEFEEIKTNPPKWIKIDIKKNIAEIIRLPLPDEIETDIDSQLIIEHYSR